MIPIDIIQKLCDVFTEENSSVKNKPFEKEWEEAQKRLEILQECIGDDKKFSRIFSEYDEADALYQGATNDYFFREGFLRGAWLMMEICGVENKKG